MELKKKLPIGIEDFKKIRDLGYYYIDKTGLIKELLDSGAEVNLFTRPRRFGKSLNMSMLKAFFEYGCEKSLFEGLEITRERELCEQYMGRFPVICISLKDINESNFYAAQANMRFLIGSEAMRFQFLLESDRLTEFEKQQYKAFLAIDDRGDFTMSDTVLFNSISILSNLLCKHYNQKVVVLIDEYDVPLDKAQQNGYYDSMIFLIRNMFSKALKTNDSLYFAVLTGCLRISKESIFTGLNNLKVYSITNVQFDEWFGFREKEVQEMLAYYELEDKQEIVKTWYDGYRFGNSDVYCPWDVVNYVDDARVQEDAEPTAYWLNTSENRILRTFFEMAAPDTMEEIDRLINGESIRKKVIQELTYKDLYRNLDQIWSVLFTTGYLTSQKKISGDIFQLVIPNLEVKKIFVEQIRDWFDEETHKNAEQLDEFCQSFVAADADAIELQLNDYLDTTVGIHDYSIRQVLKENYYHGLLVGLLKHRAGWVLSSNEEAGTGYCDIMIKVRKKKIGILIEVKYAKDGDLEAACAEALEQIENNHYEKRLLQDGMTSILKYGIAFYKKTCKVVLAELSSR